MPPPFVVLGNTLAFGVEPSNEELGISIARFCLGQQISVNHCATLSSPVASQVNWPEDVQPADDAAQIASSHFYCKNTPISFSVDQTEYWLVGLVHI